MATTNTKNNSGGSAEKSKTTKRNSATGRMATTNGSKAKPEMSAADKATLKAWRATYKSRNKSCAE